MAWIRLLWNLACDMSIHCFPSLMMITVRKPCCPSYSQRTNWQIWNGKSPTSLTTTDPRKVSPISCRSCRNTAKSASASWPRSTFVPSLWTSPKRRLDCWNICGKAIRTTKVSQVLLKPSILLSGHTKRIIRNWHPLSARLLRKSVQNIFLRCSILQKQVGHGYPATNSRRCIPPSFP